MSVTKPHKLIKIIVTPFEKRKCLKQVAKGFEMLFKAEQFYQTLVLLP
jgi:hypothetical protein